MALKSIKSLSRVLSAKYAGDVKGYFGLFPKTGDLLKRRDFKNAVVRLHTPLTADEIDNLTDYLDALQGEGMISISRLAELTVREIKCVVARRVDVEYGVERS